MGFLERFIPAFLSALEFHFMRFWSHWVIGVLALAASLGSSYYLFGAPQGFNPDTKVVIEKGMSVEEIADTLAGARVIRHPLVLRLILRYSGNDSAIPAGMYRFSKKEGVAAVAARLAGGDYGIPPVRITFTEGMTVRDMAAKVAENYPNISPDDFISVAGPYEGYLFPDTYLFSPAADAESMAKMMRDNFNEKIKPLEATIASSTRSLSDIVVMASLIEKEARRSDERRVISGILWNRIARGMPLQVDAVFGYVFSRNTFSPAYSDLAVDSPYNIYKYIGLPPGPIGNPGLDAIQAALNPAATSALFYLHGKDGKMRTATTYAGHLTNQRLYLR